MGFFLVYLFIGVILLESTGLLQRINNLSLLSISVLGWYPLILLVDTSLLFCAVSVVGIPLVFFVQRCLPTTLRKSVKQFSSHVFKYWLNLYLVILLSIEVVTLFIVFQPYLWWLWTALSYLLMSIVRGFRMPGYLQRRYNITPLPDKRMEDRLMAIVGRAKVPGERIKLAVMSSKRPKRPLIVQALVTSDRKHDWIICTDTLLTHFSIDELDVIIAHELGHLVYFDLWKRRLVSSSLILFVGFGWFILSSPFLASRFSQMTGSNYTHLPWGYLGFLLLCMGLWAYRIAQWYRLQGEERADIFALQLTRNVSAFRSAMIRLTKLNRVPVRSSSSFQSHPTLAERLHLANQFEARLRAPMR